MLYEHIQEALQYIRTRTDFRPNTGLILGTGLSGMANEIEAAAVIEYTDIPHFPASTVPNHQGKLILGTLYGTPVVVMNGRSHYYEGYSLAEVTFPVRVMKFLGAERLLVSNAAGSVNPDHTIGELVFLKDHINLLPDNPLRGPNDERLGVRFPDMLHTYDKEMLDRAVEIAKKHGIRASTGVYAALTGPNLETPAEYTFLHRIGADLAGMSTVPEVLVAKHSNMKIFAVSVVTDLGYPPEAIRETTEEDVIAAAKEAGAKLSTIIKELL